MSGVRETHIHPDGPADPDNKGIHTFRSELLDRIRTAGGVYQLPGGQLLLPEVFGFCRGVEHALDMLERAVTDRTGRPGRLFLLGEIIHNPWVNDYFGSRGVKQLSERERQDLEKYIRPEDCAVIPAFGVPLPIEKRLRSLGCQIVDTSCGDVRRLWVWSERAAKAGYAVLIYGRATHDETMVTKSRLAAVGGKYLVVGDMDQAKKLCRMIIDSDDSGFSQLFSSAATNAKTLEPFGKIAQVSQTTMLYDETIQLRQLLNEAFVYRFGQEAIAERLMFQPTVCRATQERQNAAVALCSTKPDLTVVVGGFGSSNTRHLYELARRYSPSFLIEDARAIHSADRLTCFYPEADGVMVHTGWMGPDRPLRVAVLAGASCPEIVVGQVLGKLADLLS